MYEIFYEIEGNITKHLREIEFAIPKMKSINSYSEITKTEEN